MMTAPAYRAHPIRNFFRTEGNRWRRHPASALLRLLCRLSVLITIFALLAIVIDLLVKGIPHLTPELFSLKYTTENQSMLPAIINTLLIALVALLVAIPIGVGGAIYLAEYAKRNSPLVRTIRLTAVMGSLRNVITLQSMPADLAPLTAAPLPCRLPDYAACAPQHRDAFLPIPQADAAKYQPEDKCYTKILVNGQEPDTRGVRSVNENGRVWGAVLCILERLQTVIPDAFRYDWNAAGGCLTLHSGGHTVTAQVGVTHLLVDGKENLMDGQPYLTAEGALVMEVNALIPHITGTRTQYDDKVNVLRIETE